MSKFFQISSFFAAAAFVILSLEGNVNAQGRGFGGSNDFDLLRNNKVIEELDLVDDQVDEIRELQNEMRGNMQKLFADRRSDWNGKSEEERREMWAGLQEEMKTMTEEMQPRLESVFLPSQAQRFSELKFQNQIRRSGGLLSERGSGVLQEQLEISDDQLEQMKEKAKQAKATFDAKVAKLKKAAEAEVLSVLSTEQKEKYKSLIGDSFDLSQNDRRRFGRGGGRDSSDSKEKAKE